MYNNICNGPFQGQSAKPVQERLALQQMLNKFHTAIQTTN